MAFLSAFARALSLAYVDMEWLHSMDHSQSPELQYPQGSREFLMECTYSNDSPWTNVALAVVQRVIV